MAAQLHYSPAYNMISDGAYSVTGRFATSSERDTPLPPRLHKSYYRASSAAPAPRLTIRIPPMPATHKSAEPTTLWVPPPTMTPEHPAAQAWLTAVRAKPSEKHALPSDPRVFLVLALASYYRCSQPEHWLFWGGAQQAETIERVEELNAGQTVGCKIDGVYPWVGVSTATWQLQHMHGFGAWDAELRRTPETQWYSALFPTMPEEDKGDKQKAKEAAAREREQKQARRQRAKADGATQPRATKGTKRTRSEKDESLTQPEAKRACRTSSRLRTKSQDTPSASHPRLTIILPASPPRLTITLPPSPPPLTRASSTATDVTLAVTDVDMPAKKQLFVQNETIMTLASV